MQVSGAGRVSRRRSGRSGIRRRPGRPRARAVGTPPRARNGHIGWNVDVVPPALAQRRRCRRRAPTRCGTTRATWMPPTSCHRPDAPGRPGSGSGSSSIADSAKRSCRSTSARVSGRITARHGTAACVISTSCASKADAAPTPTCRRSRRARARQRLPAMDAALPLDRFVEPWQTISRPSGGERPLREGGARHGQHVAQQLLHDRRRPRALRAAAVVDRSVHPDAHHAAARGDRPRHGRPRRAADAGARARARSGDPRPGLAGSGGARAGVRDAARERAATSSRSFAARCARRPTSASGHSAGGCC